MSDGLPVDPIARYARRSKPNTALLRSIPTPTTISTPDTS
jgi:hypothetical protein